MTNAERTLNPTFMGYPWVPIISPSCPRDEGRRKSNLDGPATHKYTTHKIYMPKKEMPSGALMMLILRVLRSGPLHGYAIAQRIHTLSSEVLHVEEGALYPALQRILLKGWATAEWGVSETNRKVRFYRLTPAGRKQLEAELSEYGRVHQAIRSVLRTA
jgi:PadR family transcriptional regulator PadR